MRGSIECNSDKILVFVPELPLDLFIGIAKPNQTYIDYNSYTIRKNELTEYLKENQIVEAIIYYTQEECVITNILTESDI